MTLTTAAVADFPNTWGQPSMSQKSKVSGKKGPKMTKLGEVFKHKMNNDGAAQEAADNKRPGDMTESTLYQQLFDDYARHTQEISLVEFNEFVVGQGISAITENEFIELIAANQEFIFNEQTDEQGKFWSSVVAESAAVTGRPSIDRMILESLCEDCPMCPNMLDEHGNCAHCNFSRHGTIREDDELKVHDGAPGDHSDKGTMVSANGKAIAGTLQTGKIKPQEKTDLTELGNERTRKQKNTGASQESAGESGHVEATDGIQSKLRSGELGGKQKNTGGQWEKFENGGAGNMSGGVKQMYENTHRLTRHITEHIRRQFTEAKTGAGKFRGSYSVRVEGIVKPMVRTALAEAIVDAEELLQIFPQDKVVFEAHYEGNNKKLDIAVPMISIPKRGPIMVEHRTVFRFQEMAKDFKTVLTESGLTASSVTHPWGSAVSANITFQKAADAYHAIREGTPATI